MNEKQLEMLRKIVKRLDLITMGALLALMLVVGYIVMIRESSFQAEGIGDVKVNVLKDRLDDKEASGKLYSALKTYFPEKPTQLQDDPKLRILVQNDMFNVKAIKQQQEARKRMNDEYKKAEALYVAKKYDEAAKILDTILARDATHPEALDLKKNIEALKTAASPSPSASPTPAK